MGIYTGIYKGDTSTTLQKVCRVYCSTIVCLSPQLKNVVAETIQVGNGEIKGSKVELFLNLTC